MSSAGTAAEQTTMVETAEKSGQETKEIQRAKKAKEIKERKENARVKARAKAS